MRHPEHVIKYLMFGKELEDIGARGLLRKLRDRGSRQGPRIRIEGLDCVNFGSNDYLGLASNPSVIEASVRAAEKWGSGAGASRLLAGGCDLHAQLENLIATIKGAPAALVFGSGYSANTGAIASLASESDALFSDELNHASIIDGCRLSRAETLVYRHRDAGHLEELLLSRKGVRRKIIVTDTVFSMEGDIAPVEELNDLAIANGAVLYLDDAHGTGVLGRGRGALAHAGIAHAPHIVQMGTFSKALGSLGGFIASEGDISGFLVNTARPLIFSTALPPAAVAASIRAAEIMMEEPGLVDRLWENRARLADSLGRIGQGTGNSESPIIPIRAKDAYDATRLSEALLERGFYAPAIRPPAVREPLLRITVTAAHEADDLDRLADALGELL